MVKFNILKFKAILIIPLLTIIGCENNENPNMISSTYMIRPQVTGIYRTDEFARLIGIWREPGGLQSYPNPFNRNISVEYFLIPLEPGQVPEPVEINVKIWVVKAEGPDEQLEEILFAMGGEYVTAPGSPVRILRDTVYNSLGLYQVRWDGKDSFNRPAPSGFYKIYLQVDEELRWYDCLLARDPCELPRDFWIAGRGCH